MEKSEVVITGLGLVSSIGNSLQEAVESMKKLRSGIETYQPFLDAKAPISVLGTLKQFDLTSSDQEDWEFPAKYRVARSVLRGLSPNALFGLCAFTDAVEDAKLTPEEVSNPEVGMYTASAGSTLMLYSSLDRMKKLGVERANPKGIVSSIAGTLNFNLVSHFKIQGFSTGFVSACASSAHALGFAADAIAQGQQKRMFVVGAEDGDIDCILPFAGMRALSTNADPSTASRPFDKKRDGFVGTGGAAVIVIESRQVAEEREAKIYDSVAGWGQSSDGYNPVLPEPEGQGLARAINTALKQGKTTPDKVTYINAHAPSTPFGDMAEIEAVKEVFGTNSSAKISSTKAITGHGLSLAGSLEATLTALAIDKGFIPGSANISELDPKTEGVNILRETIHEPIEYALSNSSGFGGANVSLLFKRYHG
ncbi:MAG: beta-ketoacyl-[acyl-carrier-protein] synthase family protein [Verrucomicrobiota bacterium]